MRRSLFVVMVCTLVSFGYANEIPEPDPTKSKYWKPIKMLMFGGKEIVADGKDVVAVYLNLRADDASTVPVMVNGLIEQTPDRYIKTVYLIVERNPSPVAGVFYFTPESGRVKVETRLRFEEFSFVRAVAEMNDGTLYMSQRYVRAAGGCSAPGGGSRVDQSLLGKMRFRIEDAVEYYKPLLVQFQVRHPNESSLAADFGMDPDRIPQFIRSVDVTYNGKPVMNAQVDFSLSDNPIFRFYFTPTEEGELKFEVEDTFDRRFEHSLVIAEGVETPENHEMTEAERRQRSSF